MNETSANPARAIRDTDRYRKGRRTFTWIAIFFGTIFLAAVVWQFYLINERAKAMRGDGSDPTTYGFDLSNLTVPSETLVGAGFKKDAVVALSDPKPVTPDNVTDLKRYGAHYATIEAVDQIADGPGGAFKRILVNSDRVIGVAHKGEVRCYPIRFMRWHEIASDTLGGDPIAVTYSPLTDGVVAFRRTVNDKVITFGHSGLVFNSYHILYDTQPPEAEAQQSLWCPLLLAPIAGPAVARGDTLEAIPVWLGTWEDWRAMHPDTTVLVGDAKFGKRYKDNPFARMQYFEKKELLFPVAPMPPQTRHAHPLFDRIVAWEIPGEGWTWEIMPDEGHPEEALADVPRIYTRWFAWYSIRGE